VIALTDAMTRDIDGARQRFRPARPFFNEQQRVDLTATVAAYNMVSRFLVALRIGH
jgi:4-carboxymuconolactone decarboxylase